MPFLAVGTCRPRTCPSTDFGQRRRVLASSGKLLEQRLGVLQVGGVESLGEPAVDRASRSEASERLP
jgi:hypothetical protein